jgi:hypothetical protein
MTATAQNRFFFVILALYAVIGFALLSLYPYHVVTDTVSYVSIAQQYARLQFHDAVNWTWSPLISWLLAPLLVLGLDPLFAIRGIGLIAGMAGFFALRCILRRLEVPEKTQGIFLVALVPMFYAFSLINPNPDLLVAVILLFYVGRLLRPEDGKRHRDGLVCGSLGALAYFAKTYAFPFFIVHFSIVNACRWCSAQDRASRKAMTTSFGVGMLTFLLISAPWIYALHGKYGELTFGAMGSLNFNLLHNENGVPWHDGGFLAPPNSTAISAWDDPFLVTAGHWKVPAVAQVIESAVSRLCRNAIKVLEILQSGSVFSAAILALSVLFLVGLPWRSLPRNAVFLVLLTIVLLPSGYLFLLVDKRYVYLDILLVYSLGACLIGKWDLGDRRRKTAAVALLCLSFAFMPLRDLRATVSMNRDIHDQSVALAQAGVGGRIASNSEFDRTLLVSYFLSTGRDVSYFGAALPGVSDAELARDLEKHRIDYYLCWKSAPCAAPGTLLSGFEEIDVFRVKGR